MAATEEEPPPPKKSLFACLTNLPQMCVPQKQDVAGDEKPASPTSVASRFTALSPYNRKRKQEEKATKAHEEQKLRDQFRRVDTDHSGKVDRHELKYLLNRVTGSTPSEAELDDMLNTVDTSGDGLIDFEEFQGIHAKAKSGELRFAELARVMTEFDELVGLLDDDDGTVVSEQGSSQKKPRLKSPLGGFLAKTPFASAKKEAVEAPAEPAVQFDEPEASVEEAAEAPVVESLETRQLAKTPAKSPALPARSSTKGKTPPLPARPSTVGKSAKSPPPPTAAKTPAKSPPLPARSSTKGKSPPLPQRPTPSATQADDTPAPVAIEDDAPVPAPPSTLGTPDGPRRSGAMLADADDESESDDEATPDDDDAGEAADRVGPLSPMTPAPEPTPMKTVEDDIAAESITSFSP